MLMTRTPLVSLLTLLLPVSVYAWGSPGHQAVGEVAQANLDDSTRKAIAKILGQGEVLAPGALARIATWPDDIRDYKVSDLQAKGWSQVEIDEAHIFRSNHPAHGDWHFVDLPLAAEGYPDLQNLDPQDPVTHFVKPEDIV